MTDDKKTGRRESVIIEGYWICPNCETKNRGALQSCSACGAVRGNVEFHCDDDAPVVTDEEEKKRAMAGADWICTFCGNSSSAGSDKCSGCGADRSQGEKRETRDVPLDKTGKPMSKPKTSPVPPIKTPPKPMSPAAKIFGWGFLLLIVAMIGLQCMSFEDAMEVTHTEWMREVKVHEYKTVSEENWQDSLPGDARRINEEKKVRTHKDVLVGHEDVEETYVEKVQTGTRKERVERRDLGNGRFEDIYEDKPVYEEVEKTRRVKKPVYRKDPVYDTWIKYEVDKWIEIEPAISKGLTEKPVWPDTGFSETASPVIGNRRTGEKKESYKVVLTSSKGKQYEINEYQNKPLSEEMFLKLPKGSKCKVILSGLDHVKEIHPENIK